MTLVDITLIVCGSVISGAAIAVAAMPRCATISEHRIRAIARDETAAAIKQADARARTWRELEAPRV